METFKLAGIDVPRELRFLSQPYQVRAVRFPDPGDAEEIRIDFGHEGKTISLRHDYCTPEALFLALFHATFHAAEDEAGVEISHRDLHILAGFATALMCQLTDAQT